MVEWQEMFQTLKRCGVKFHIHWMPAEGGGDSLMRRSTFTSILKQYGFNLTPLATNAFVIGDIYYVYSTGQPHWTAYEDDPNDMSGHKGWGEDGMFLFSWNSKTGEHHPRVLYNGDCREVVAEGLAAIERLHGPFPKFTPRTA